MVSAKGFVHLPWKALLTTWFGRLSFENQLQYRWRLLSTLSYASIDLAGNSSSNKYRGHKFKRCLSNDDSQIVESRLRMYTHERSNTTAATSYLSANLFGDHEFLRHSMNLFISNCFFHL